MTRRRITIGLHWANVLLMLLILSAGPVPGLAWPFVVSSLLMCALALVLGLANRPGPKLEGGLRVAHPWASRAIYLVLGLTGALTAAHLLGHRIGPPLADMYMILLFSSLLHAIFHVWRHTALGDGALRRMFPRSFHNVL